MGVGVEFEALLSNGRINDSLYAFSDFLGKSVIICRADGSIIFINSTALNGFGISNRDTFLARNPNVLISRCFIPAIRKAKFCTANQSFRNVFNFENFKKEFPDICVKSDKTNQAIKTHIEYDSDGCASLIYISFEDVPSIKGEKSLSEQLLDFYPLIMETAGVSSWLYDLTSGLRIAISGDLCCASIEQMEDFLLMIDSEDRHTLINIMSLITSGHKLQGHLTIRINVISHKSSFIYLDVICLPKYSKNSIDGIFFITKDATDNIIRSRAVNSIDKLLSQEKEKAEIENKLVNSIIEMIPCAMFIKDIEKDYKYIRANSQFINMTGKSNQNIIGNSDFDLFNLKLAQKNRQRDIETVEKKTITSRVDFDFAEKDKKWSLTQYYLEIKNRKLIIGIAQDLTELLDSYDKIEYSKLLAERSDKMKSVFLTNVCHELITPLNSTLGFASLILDSPQPEDLELFKSEIERNSKILKETIGEIIDLSEMEAESAQIKSEFFNLKELLEDIGNEYEATVQSGVEFRYNFPKRDCIISLDKTYLIKIIKRGLFNSIANTYSGYVELGYYYTEKEVTLYIEDSGIGLSNDEILAVKGSYEKITEFTNKIAFSMSLCALIAKAMGGNVDIQSEKNGITKTSVSFKCNFKLL